MRQNTVETHQTQPGFYKDLGILFKGLSKVLLHTFEVCAHVPTLTHVEKHPNTQTKNYEVIHLSFRQHIHHQDVRITLVTVRLTSAIIRHPTS